ncbi:putative HTH-type transcriptional regulator YxaF [mine drainage metagenome]|uniref:Putative HTH-type transcriptional regulator YxaF n=1 Tax=mine drainage metagenome TaxID=410659 RepID=A0A1J5RUX2_9ZZZZ
MPAPHLSRDDLLNRLHETFRRHGYEGASMSRLAAASGLGKASLYHHFPGGKDQMVEAVLEHVRARYEEDLFRPLETVHPPRQRLLSMLRTLAQDYDNGDRNCLPALLALTPERDRFTEAISALFSRWLDCMTQLLIDAGLARDIATRRAHDGVERIQGAIVLTRALGMPKPFVGLMADLPDQLLAGADRGNIWSSRPTRLPAAPAGFGQMHAARIA